MTNIKHYCYNHYQINAIIRKSYGVTLLPEKKLCNSERVLTDVIRTVISGI
ncbi:hypothetical protein [Klebsiella michiganensis]|uniref:hypothetical protein n=1 Tax=Klebsiella michiganensis TaxID=1134687 RepID=UPI003F8D392F